jgi:hypothetical protein
MSTADLIGFCIGFAMVALVGLYLRAIVRQPDLFRWLRADTHNKSIERAENP